MLAVASGAMWPGCHWPVAHRAAGHGGGQAKVHDRALRWASTITFEGFKSRCTMPAAWAACRPSSTSTIRGHGVVRAQRPCRSRCSASVQPGTYSKRCRAAGPARRPRTPGRCADAPGAPHGGPRAANAPAPRRRPALHRRQQLDGHLRCRRGSCASHTLACAPAQQAPEFKPPYGGGLRSAAGQQALGGGSGAKSGIVGFRFVTVCSRILCLPPVLHQCLPP